MLLWTIGRPERLPKRFHDIISSRDNRIFFSTISIWEIAIKAAMGKPGFDNDPEIVLREAEALGFIERLVTSEQTIAAAKLPHHHRDPFARLLTAQPLVEPSRFVTADRILALYSELVDLI